MIHRDIAARNVLVTKDFVGKISDLGLSRVLNSVGSQCSSTGGHLGAIKWMAPESISAARFDEKTDSFSFGVSRQTRPGFSQYTTSSALH